MIMTLFFKIWNRVEIQSGSLNKKMLLLKWKSLYRDRLVIHSNFNFGKSFSFHFDASHSTVHIGNGLEVRDHFEVRSGNNGKLNIGDKVFFNNGCSVHCLTEISIGNNNQFGEGVKMYDHNHQYKESGKLISEQGYSFGAIKIGNNCWIGSNVIILKDVEIGDNVVIGAGCIIHKSVPAGTVVVNHQSLDFIKYRD